MDQSAGGYIRATAQKLTRSFTEPEVLLRLDPTLSQIVPDCNLPQILSP
jgi:hypothetical protein